MERITCMKCALTNLREKRIDRLCGAGFQPAPRAGWKPAPQLSSTLSNRLLNVVWVVLLCVGLAGCGNGDESVLSVSGQIEVVDVDVGSRIGGRIKEVLVKEGDSVESGAILVQIEDDEAKALVAAAQSKVAGAQATLDKLIAGARPEEIEQARAAAERAREQYQMALKGARSEEIEVARSAVTSAEAARDNASAEYRRLAGLREASAVSEQLFDQAKHGLDGAEAQLRAATEKLDMLVAGLRSEEIAMAKAAADQAQAAHDLAKNGARAEDIRAAEAARDVANAELQRAEVGADEMTVVSPRKGIVESIDVYPGDIVRPGPIARIVDPEELELIVYVGARALGHLQVGQEVSLTTDSHGDERFKATIARVASQGEYTPRNLQTQEERVQQVFGIKLTLDSAGGKLRAGMTATVHFDLVGTAKR